MGRARGTYKGKERCRQFWRKNVWERDHLEDLGVDGRIILKQIFKKWDGGTDWINLLRIDLVQYMDRWQAVANAVMNLRSS